MRFWEGIKRLNQEEYHIYLLKGHTLRSLTHRYQSRNKYMISKKDKLDTKTLQLLMQNMEYILITSFTYIKWKQAPM